MTMKNVMGFLDSPFYMALMTFLARLLYGWTYDTLWWVKFLLDGDVRKQGLFVSLSRWYVKLWRPKNIRKTPNTEDSFIFKLSVCVPCDSILFSQTCCTAPKTCRFAGDLNKPEQKQVKPEVHAQLKEERNEEMRETQRTREITRNE